MSDAFKLILQILAPVLTLTAVIAGIRGKNWDEKIGRGTRTGYLVVSIGVLSMLTSVSSDFVSKYIDDRDRANALQAQSALFAAEKQAIEAAGSQEKADAKQMSDAQKLTIRSLTEQKTTLGAQLKKEEETLSVARVARLKLLPVESIELTWDLSPNGVRSSQNLLGIEGKLEVSYKARAEKRLQLLFGMESIDIDDTVRGSLNLLLKSAFYDLEISSDHSNNQIDVDFQTIDGFYIDGSYVHVTLKPQGIDAGFFKDASITFGTQTSPPDTSDRPEKIEIKVMGPDVEGAARCKLLSKCRVDIKLTD